MWYKYCPDCGKRSPVWIDSIGVQRLMCCEQAVDIRQAEREIKRAARHKAETPPSPISQMHRTSLS